MTFTDADLSDTHTVTVTRIAHFGHHQRTGGQSAVLGWLSLGTLTDTTGTGTGGL